MRPARPVFVVGGASTVFYGRGRPEFVSPKHPDFAHRAPPTLEGLMRSAVHDAVTLSGVPAQAIEKAYVGNFLGELFVKQGHAGALLAMASPALAYKPIARVEAACASGGVAVASCVDAIAAGADVALAVGVEVETTLPSEQGADFMARAAHYATQAPLEPNLFAYLFARRAKAYRDAFGDPGRALARIVAHSYACAARNPLAQMERVQVTEEMARSEGPKNRRFLQSPELREHIWLLDCTHFTDGASAVVLVSEEGLRRYGIRLQDATEILSMGHVVAPLGEAKNLERMETSARAAEIAYADAGLGPGDMEIAELHDCFSIAALQLVEALGFSKLGEGSAFFSDEAIPVNTGGGLLGFGHPVGATGVKQVAEIWKQMVGAAGGYQLSKRPRTGVTANLGGDDRTSIVMIQRACG